MGRPRKEQQDDNMSEKKEEVVANASVTKAKFLQLHAGIDRLGGSLTISLGKNAKEIVLTNSGFLVLSKKSDEKLFVPYANVRGAVLL